MRYNCGDLSSQIGANCPLPIISTNGYYGYQPVRNQPEIKPEEHQNQMEIDPVSYPHNANMMVNNSNNFALLRRKRTNNEPIEAQAFKKRRQNEYMVKNKENVEPVDKITEEDLLQNIHGFSLHYWKRESDL